MAESPPPSYDELEILNIPEAPSGGNPSAPPISATGSPRYSPPSPSPYNEQSSERARLNVAQQGSRRAPTTTASSRTPSKTNGRLEAYISYSTPHLLRMNIEPKGELEDPELDVEAHLPRAHVENQRRMFARRRRLQCISGWLYCIGVIQVLIYIGLPIAMIVTGVLGFNDCPFRSKTIVIYLLTGGSILAVVILFRIFPSCCTCCKNHNVLRSKSSEACSACICLMECFFLLIFIVSIAILILGTYWVFHQRPLQRDECADIEDCEYCSTAVYIGSAVYIVLQYTMYVFSGLYLCLVFFCNRHFTRELTRL